MATKFEKLIRGFVETRSSWDSVFLRNIGREQLDKDVLSSPYKKSDLVYTCISTTGRAVSQVPLLKYTQTGGDEYEPVFSGDPWQALIDNPNPLMDGYRFKEAIISYYLLDGDVFVLPFPPRSMGGTGGVPDALYVIGKAYMEPRRNERTGQLDGWTYKPKGEEKEKFLLENSEVIHFSTWNPDDPIMGQAPIEAGGIHVNVDYKASVFNEKFFDNAAVPAGMITTPAGVGFGEKKKERLKAELEGMHGGFRKAFKLMFLEKGLKYEKIGATHQEMMFKDLRFMSRESIMQAYGMKKAVISVTEDLNYATAEAQKRAWWEDTNIPMMSMIANGFTHHLMGPEGAKILRMKYYLLSRYGRQKGASIFREEIKELQQKAVAQGGELQSYFDFDTSGVKALQEDFQKKVDTGSKLWRMGFTGNEINQRLELGFDEDKPWRDSWWVQQSFTPIGDDFGEEPPPEDPPEEPPPPPTDDEPPTEEPPADIQPASPAASGRSMTKGQKQHNQFLNKMTPIESKFQSKIERFFWEIRKKSLKYLLKYHDPEGLMKEEFGEETSNLVKWVSPIYREAMAAGIRSASEEIVEVLAELDEMKRGAKEKGLKSTFSIDVNFLMDNDPAVLSYLEARNDWIGQGKRKEGRLTQTVRDQITSELHIGQANAEGIQELADRIKGKLKGNVSRARTIARTETISVANFGRSRAMEGSGFTKKIWRNAGDSEVRPSHRAVAAGGPIDMGKPWIVGGCSLSYPCDYEAGCPSETINCRCVETVDPDSHPAFQKDKPTLVEDPVAIKEKGQPAWKSEKHARIFKDEMNFLRKTYGKEIDKHAVIHGLRSRMVEHCPSMHSYLYKWQDNASGKSAMVFRAKVAAMESSRGKDLSVIVPKGKGPDYAKSLDRLARELDDGEYIRLRAISQYYLERYGKELPEYEKGRIVLYRGTDGDTGKRLGREVERGITNGDEWFEVRNSSAAGHSSDLEIAESFGTDTDGIVVRNRAKFEEVIVHHDVWVGDDEYTFEMESILIGGDRRVSLDDIATIDKDFLKSLLAVSKEQGDEDEEGQLSSVVIIQDCDEANTAWLKSGRLKKKADKGDEKAKEELEKMESKKFDLIVYAQEE